MKIACSQDKQFNVLIVQGVTRSNKPSKYLSAFRHQTERSGGMVMQLSMAQREQGEAWRAILAQRWSVLVIDGHHHYGDLQKPIVDLDFGQLNEAGAKIDAGLLIVGSCWSSQLRPVLPDYICEGAHVLLWQGICTYQHGFDVFPGALDWALQGMPAPRGLESAARTFRGRRHIDLLTVNSESAD